ncbi:MAG: DUF4340 domain-containing protein [Methylococcaceae bacterium]|nr:DUF4340 domain-containing protein [Methylococcaceae bacterium]
MARQSQFLSILLVLQVVLAAILYFAQSESGAFVSNEKLLDLKFDALNKIVIEEADKKTLMLEKRNNKWTLPAYFDFPASKEKLERVFGKLFDTNIGWPVATTESAEKRFKVAGGDFERKLAFSTADASTTLYLGTSPGFKKIHARLDGQTTIYGIEFSAYQASTKPIDWADQSILHVPREDIDAIEIAGLSIKRAKDKFVIEGLAAGEEAVEPEIQSLLGKVSSIGFQDVLGKKDDPAYQLGSPALELTLVKKNGQRVAYRYGKLKDKDEVVLKPSDSEYYFNVPKYNVDSLLEINRAKLVKSAAPVPEQNQESGKPAVPPEANKVAPSQVTPKQQSE